MSLRLQQDTTPLDVEIKAYDPGLTFIRGSPDRIGPKDMVALVEYWLTNTSLEKDDPRREFAERLHEMEVIEGYDGPGSQRLHVPDLPTP